YIGRTHERAADFETAHRFYEEAQAWADEVEDPQLVSVLLSSLSKVEYSMNDLRGALQHDEELLRLAAETGDDTVAIAAQLGMAGTFRRDNDEELAVVHARKSLDLATAASNEQFRARALMMLAGSYEALGRDREATEARDKALEISRRINDFVNLGETLKARGFHRLRQRQYGLALDDLQESLTV